MKWSSCCTSLTDLLQLAWYPWRLLAAAYQERSDGKPLQAAWKAEELCSPSLGPWERARAVHVRHPLQHSHRVQGLPAQAAWEAEELRSRALGLEERARRAEGHTEAERARRLETERALQASREREAALQVRFHRLERTCVSGQRSTARWSAVAYTGPPHMGAVQKGR